MKFAIPRKLIAAGVCAALASAAVAAAPAPSPPPTPASSIYKLVDASGKITYTNTPVKGAVKVELDPITVIPPTPSGSLGGAALAATQAAAQTAQAIQPAQASPPAAPPALPPAPVLIPVNAVPTIASPMAPTAAPGPSVATVTPISNAKQAKPAPVRSAPDPVANLPVVKLSPNMLQGPAPASNTPTFAATPPAAAVASAAPSAETIAQQRRDELKAKALASAIEREEQLLAEAAAQLTEERRASESFRKLRAGLAAKPDSTNPQAAAIKSDIRAQVERHFERIRDLEDQVSMHQRNLEQYRQQSGGAPKAG